MKNKSNEFKFKKGISLIGGFVLFVVLIAILVFFLSRFGGSKSNSKFSSFSIKNDVIGYTTTFSYDKSKYENYEELKNEYNDLPNVSIENSELHLVFNIHYDTMPLDNFNSIKELCQSYDYYKELKVDKYDIYFASNDNVYSSGYILINSYDEYEIQMVDTVYFSIYNASEREAKEFYEALDDKSVITFLESISIEKGKVSEKKNKAEDLEVDNNSEVNE